MRDLGACPIGSDDGQQKKPLVKCLRVEIFSDSTEEEKIQPVT